MHLPHGGQCLLPKLLVADGRHGAGGHGPREQRAGIDGRGVGAGESLQRGQDLPGQRGVALRQARGVGRQGRGEEVGQLLAARAVLPGQVELRLHVRLLEIAADGLLGSGRRGVPLVRRLRAGTADDDLRILTRRGPPRRPLLLGDDPGHGVAHFRHGHRPGEALEDAGEEVGGLLRRFLAHFLRVRELLAQHVARGERHEVLRGRAEGDGDALVLLEVETGDAELRVQLRHHAGAAAGHEEHLSLVVLQPHLDLLRALDGVRGRFVEVGVVEDALEALVRAVRAAKGLLDRGAELRGVLGETAQLLQHRQALGPELPFQQNVGEKSEERIGLRALLGLAENLGDADERLGVGGIALELVHPERFQPVELLLFNQSASIFNEPQRHDLRRDEPRIVNERAGGGERRAGGLARFFRSPLAASRSPS